MVRLIRDIGKYYPLFKADGELNDKLPKTIIKSLGPPAEQYVETLKSEKTKLKDEMMTLINLKQMKL